MSTKRNRRSNPSKSKKVPREMDLAVGSTDLMKNIVAKGIQTEMNASFNPSSGYVTEKMYMLLQLYLQNKGWNHEFLQMLTELKDPSMIPTAGYLQMMASRIMLDSQGRLVLRENGKIILPFEHFANAVMLKHMSGLHGLHLGVEATLRAVMDSYTMGRENFGMEKEFVIEVVNNCPNAACRFYKTQLDLTHSKPTYAIPSDPSILKNSPSSSSAGQSSSMSQQSTSQQQCETSDSERLKGTPIPPSQSLPSQHKLSDFLKANIENFDSLTNANKDLLAVHNGAWSDATDSKRHSSSSSGEVGQEKVVRAFNEIMKNMTRMKTCIRPSMCKPYGKQSEALQKTLMDTIQLVQSLRSILPPPHIQVSSWKNEDKHSGRDSFSQGEFSGLDRM